VKKRREYEEQRQKRNCISAKSLLAAHQRCRAALLMALLALAWRWRFTAAGAAKLRSAAWQRI